MYLGHPNKLFHEINPYHIEIFHVAQIVRERRETTIIFTLRKVHNPFSCSIPIYHRNKKYHVERIDYATKPNPKNYDLFYGSDTILREKKYFDSH